MGAVAGRRVLATSLVYLTGGAESPFTFAYLVAVVAGAILLFQKGALVTAGASAVAFTTLVLLVQSGQVAPPPGGAILSAQRVVFPLVSNVLAQFLIAVLAGYLSRQLRVTGGKLSARESDLRTLANLQRQILASMPSGLVTCDVYRRVTFINRAAEQILGLEASAAVGGDVEEVLQGVTKLGPDARRVVLEVRTPLGDRTLGLTASSMDSEPGSLLIVFQDLTDLRRMEDELKRVDRLAALGKLSAQLAHEIRNPLAAMRGSAQMLMDVPEQKSARRLAEILVRESDRLSQLLENVLRFARPPPPQLQATSLRNVVLQTLEMLQGDPNLRVSGVETRLEDVQAVVDPDQVRQVLLNLLRNAMAAVAKEGRIAISLSMLAGQAELRVWDSAGSIPAGDLGRVFEPFFTTRAAGSGLGLSTAHSIVRAHGGTIRVTSSPESGTEFVVTLPATSEVRVADSGR